MPYLFAPMTPEQAREVVTWRYDPPYDFYNMDADEEGLHYMLDPHNPYYAAIDEDQHGDMAGFFCFQDAARTLAGFLAGAYRDPDALDIGLGLRPALAGRGRGLDFMNAGLAFARETFHPASFRLSVATFNRRAIAVYERAGFRPAGAFTHTSGRSVYEFMTMTRPATTTTTGAPMAK